MTVERKKNRWKRVERNSTIITTDVLKHGVSQRPKNTALLRQQTGEGKHMGMKVRCAQIFGHIVYTRAILP